VCRLGDFVHHHIDPAGLRVVERLGPCAEILAWDEVERRVDRVQRVHASECRHVGIVGEINSIDPHVVELALEGVQESEIGTKVGRILREVGVRLNRNQIRLGKVRRREFDNLLASEDERLPMEQVWHGRCLAAHRDSGGPELVEHRQRRVGPRLDNKAHPNPGLEAGDDRVHEQAVFLDGLDGDIHAHRLAIDVAKHDGTAVLKGWLAPFVGLGRERCEH
jgi:hypothetical protein